MVESKENIGRWYQLSILQILVAMAILATVLALNLNIHRTKQSGIWNFKYSKAHVVEVKMSAGWPCSYFYQFSSTISSSPINSEELMTIDPHEVQPLPFLINVIVATGILFAGIVTIGHLQRQRRT